MTAKSILTYYPDEDDLINTLIAPFLCLQTIVYDLHRRLDSISQLWNKYMEHLFVFLVSKVNFNL